MRSAGRHEVGAASVVTRATKSTIACFAGPSFHDGSGSAAGRRPRAPASSRNRQRARARPRAGALYHLLSGPDGRRRPAAREQHVRRDQRRVALRAIGRCRARRELEYARSRTEVSRMTSSAIASSARRRPRACDQAVADIGGSPGPRSYGRLHGSPIAARACRTNADVAIPTAMARHDRRSSRAASARDRLGRSTSLISEISRSARGQRRRQNTR